MTIYAEGVDYSGGWPPVAAMRAAGKTFVVRYVAAGVRGKEITRDEVGYWRAAGISIVIVYESTAGRALEGRAAGVQDAQVARDDVRNVGGPSDGGVVYFAVDVDTTSDSQRAAAVDYLTGAASVLGWGHVGVYGEYDLIGYVAAHCDCRWFWQTYAWSGGRLHPAAQLYQYRNAQTLGGVEVDLDRAYAPNFGQWPEGDTDMTPEEFAAAAVAGTLDPAFTRQAQILASYGIARAVDVRTAVAPLLNDEAVISAAVADKASAVLGAIAALPTEHLTEQERAELAADIAGQVEGLDAAAVLDALAGRLAS